VTRLRGRRTRNLGSIDSRDMDCLLHGIHIVKAENFNLGIVLYDPGIRDLKSPQCCGVSSRIVTRR
jgi:hypothetical protein